MSTHSHIFRTELACARALLNELEALYDASTQSDVRPEVVVQAAEQLVVVAEAMKRCAHSEGVESPLSDVEKRS